MGANGGKEPESDFEVAVIRALRDAGFECDAQVGFAGFRIDIAIRDPQARERCVLAVECDGATYHSSRSARDRDRLRQEVLEGLGWEVMRIWSTDWYRNQKREIDRITGRLQEILAARSRAPGEPVKAEEPASEAEPAPPTTVPARPVLTIVPSPPARESARQLPLPAMPAGRPPRTERLPVGPRTLEDARDELIRFREEVIHAERPSADRTRGLLRKTMLDSLLRYRPTSAEEFRERVPQALRERTDPEQFRLYAKRVFEILEELSAS
jgi:very-short-patch-repair endonuclease